MKRALLVFLLILAGCEDGPPDLGISATRAWAMPPDGSKVPAPRGIRAAPDGEVFVLDTGGRVLAYSADGKLQRHWPMPESDVGKPENLRVLKDGSVCVPDTHYHRIIIVWSDAQSDEVSVDCSDIQRIQSHNPIEQ